MRCRSLLYKEIIVGDYPIIGSTAIMPYKEEFPEQLHLSFEPFPSLNFVDDL